MAMVKKVIDLDSLGLHLGSLKSMVNTLANMIGDEVYIRPVLEIESSEQVIKALESVLEGVKGKPKKKE
jgi:hypothetical protein